MRTSKPTPNPEPVVIEVVDARAQRRVRYDEDVPLRIYNMALLGLAVADMARLMVVPVETLHGWLENRVACRDAYDKGMYQAVVEVEVALRKKAVGYTYIETRTVEGLDGIGRPYSSTTHTTKEVAPDPVAAQAFLKANAPRKYREQAQTNVNILNVDMSKTLEMASVSAEEKELLRSIAIKKIAEENVVHRD